MWIPFTESLLGLIIKVCTQLISLSWYCTKFINKVRNKKRLQIMFSEVSWDRTLTPSCLAEERAKKKKNLEKAEWHHKTNSNSAQDWEK